MAIARRNEKLINNENNIVKTALFKSNKLTSDLAASGII